MANKEQEIIEQFYSLDIITHKTAKELYRKLSMKHHPDKGGSTEDFKDLQEVYSLVLDGLNGVPHPRDFNISYKANYLDCVRRYFYYKNLKISLIRRPLHLRCKGKGYDGGDLYIKMEYPQFHILLTDILILLIPYYFTSGFL